MAFFNKHGDAIVTSLSVITSVVIATCWINTKFATINERMDARFSQVEKELAIIKTVMVMKGIMPEVLAVEGDK